MTIRFSRLADELVWHLKGYPKRLIQCAHEGMGRELGFRSDYTLVLDDNRHMRICFIRGDSKLEKQEWVNMLVEAGYGPDKFSMMMSLRSTELERIICILEDYWTE